MKRLTRIGVVLFGLLAIASSGYGQPVAQGQIETRHGYAAASVSHETNMMVLTLSETDGDGNVRVAYMMPVAAGTKAPIIKKIVDVEYKGNEHLQLSVGRAAILVFLLESGPRVPKIENVVVGGFERLGIVPNTFENHASAAEQLLAWFTHMPKRPSRDKRPPN